MTLTEALFQQVDDARGNSDSPVITYISYPMWSVFLDESPFDPAEFHQKKEITICGSRTIIFPSQKMISYSRAQ